MKLAGVVIVLAALLAVAGCNDSNSLNISESGNNAGASSGGGSGNSGSSGGGTGSGGNPPAAGSIFLNIVPPGSDGNSAGGVGVQGTGVDIAEPPHWADQSKLYGDLSYAKSPLTAKPCDSPPSIALHKKRSDNVCNYFKHEGLTPDVVTSSTALTAPSGGTVTIKRDGWGVPFIEGPTRADAMYGVGYAAAHDRLWLWDVLRHVGRGHLSEFLGPAPDTYGFDADIAVTAAYSEAEFTQMVNQTRENFGPLGDVFISDLDQFVAGMNAYISTLLGANLAQLPPEYATLGLPNATLQPPVIRPFTRNDIVASAILIQSIFATGGGSEPQAELLLQHLDPSFGPGATSVPKAACEFWRDVRHADDPDATRSIQRVFSTQTPPRVGEGCPRPLRPGVAIWDVGSYSGRAIFTATDLLTSLQTPTGITSALGGLLNTLGTTLNLPALGALLGLVRADESPLLTPKTHTYLASINPREGARRALARAGFPLPKTMSNWIAVTAEHTKSGHPIAVMGPQTSYFEPELLWEFAVKSNGGTPLDFNGRGIATANLPYIVIGRSLNFAWSATSGNSDLTDTRVSKMCNLDGSVPSREDVDGDGFPDADGYQFLLPGDATPICAPFIKRTDNWTAVPTVASLVLGGPPLPQTVQRFVMRTHYGPVIATATVNGWPVAVSQQRSTFFDELGTVTPFALASTHVIHDAVSFKQVFNGVTGTFNWLYIDKNDIAYIHSGLYPIRSPGQDLDLPVWGNGQFEWQAQANLTADFFANRSAANPYPSPAVPVAQPQNTVQVNGKAVPTFFQWPGYMAYADHPQIINPDIGYMMSWNNSPAKGWRAADFNGSYGPIHRVDMLAERLKVYLDTGKKEDVGSMVETMADAGYTDLRGQELLPLMLQIMQKGSLSAEQQQVVTLMQHWMDDDSSVSWIGAGQSLGSFRRDRDGDGIYDHRAAVALMDAWYKHMQSTVTPQLDAVDKAGFSVGQGRFNAPGPTGSAFQSGWFQHMTRLLRMAMGSADHPYQALACAGSGTLTDCRAAVLTALAAAITDLGGLSNQANWGAGIEAAEQIEPTNFSLLPTPPIPWVNRPTFQQVIEIH